jgi:hypothetical protein
MFMHLEDYLAPLEFLPVSKSTHAALHGRFRDPARWSRLVARHYVHGAWFTFLTMDEADMRRPFGEIYPLGLPKVGELWPALADRLGVTPLIGAGRRASLFD